MCSSVTELFILTSFLPGFGAFLLRLKIMGLAWRMQVLRSLELGPDLLCATFLVKGSADIIERADLGRRELNAHEGLL